MNDANGRVVMISGANRGLGAAIARRLIGDGWRVSLGMRRPHRPEWAADPDRAQLYAYEATAGAEKAWTDAVLKQFGRIDAVIPNAGIFVHKTVIEADDADLDAMYEVNVKAPRRLVQAAWPSLIASGRGRVIIVASLSGKRVSSPRSGLYSITKHAAVALAHAIRHEGWSHGVRATALCPGLADTEMGRGLVPDRSQELTHPDDIASLVALALDLRNSASVAELYVNCNDGETY